MMGVWVAIMAGFAILRHARLNSSAYDLAIQGQVFWTTAHGHLFVSSLEVGNYLGDHVQPIILLLAPLYRLLPDVRLLLVWQAAALGLGALPVFWMARRVFESEQWGLLFAAVYLLTPALGFMVRFDFHVIIFCIPLLLLAFNDLEQDKLWRASAWAVLAIFCKEEIGLTVAATGLYLALARRRPRFGVAWLVGGLGWSLIALFVVIPAFRNGLSDTLGRYNWLGHSPVELLRTLITRPGFVWEHQFSEPLRWKFLGLLLLPGGFLALLSPILLATGLPVLGYNLLSDIPSQSSIYFHYIAPMIPILIVASIKGTAWLRERLAGRVDARVLPAWLAATSLLAWGIDVPFTTLIEEPYYPVYGLEQFINRQAFNEARALIPEGAPLSTTMAFAPHFTDRLELDLFYFKGQREAEVYSYAPAAYLLLHLTDLRWGVNPHVYHAMIETAIGRDGYQAVYFREDVLLLARNGSPALTGAVLQRTIDLQDGGGRFSPTGEATQAYIVEQWTFDEMPALVQAAADFEGDIELLGYSIAPAPPLATGGPLCVTLYWRANAPQTTSLTAFVHLAAGDGFVHAQRDSVPMFGFAPTLGWQPGAIIGDMHCMAVPAGLVPEEYGLNVGLYDGTTGERLEVRQSELASPLPGMVQVGTVGLEGADE